MSLLARTTGRDEIENNAGVENKQFIDLPASVSRIYYDLLRHFCFPEYLN